MGKERKYLSAIEVRERIKRSEGIFGENTSCVPDYAYRNKGIRSCDGLVCYTYITVKRGPNKGMYHRTPINYAS